MKNVAVICEFDPLHRGHEYLLRSVREAGAEKIVCVMSGVFCQRGEPATFSMHTRAAAALAAGADVVLELPFPYSASSAEFFAMGAVSVIGALGCIDTLAFGSESGDVTELCTAAERLCSESFALEYKRVREEDRSKGAASAIELAYGRLWGDTQLFWGANNILALEYIKEAKKQGLELSFFSVKRKGAGHGEMCERDSYASATLIRRMITEGVDIRGLLPENSSDIIIDSIKKNGISRGLCAIESAILSHFRMLVGEDCSFAESGGGLHNRMVAAAERAQDLCAFTETLKTKKYTDARLRRAIVFSMCGVTDADLRTGPTYTTLLGATRAGIELLSEIKKAVKIPIVSTPAALSALDEVCHRQLLLSRRAHSLRALTLATPTDAEHELRLPPVVIR